MLESKTNNLEVLVKGVNKTQDKNYLIDSVVELLSGVDVDTAEKVLLAAATKLTKCDKKTEAYAFVYKTTNYGLFHEYDDNRTPIGNQVDVLVDSIKKYGYVLAPIVVGKDFGIVDGQHRCRACERLNEPVFYVMDKKATSKAASTMNRSQANWKTKDFISFYASSDESYKKLQQLLKDYKTLSDSTIISVSTKCYNNSSNGFSAKMIKEGKLFIDDEQEQDIRSALDMLLAYKNLTILKGIQHKDKLFNAICYFVYKEKCDGTKMLRNFMHCTREEALSFKTGNFKSCMETVALVYGKGPGRKKQFCLDKMYKNILLDQKRKKELLNI